MRNRRINGFLVAALFRIRRNSRIRAELRPRSLTHELFPRQSAGNRAEDFDYETLLTRYRNHPCRGYLF